MIVKLLLLLMLVTRTQLAAFGQSSILFNYDFESGGYSGWGTQAICCADSLKIVTAPAIGSRSLKAYLNSQDPCFDPAYCSVRNTSDRVELVRRIGGPGKTNWYGLSIYLDPSFRQQDADPNGLLFSQWHPGDRAISPYLLIAIKNNAWYVRSEAPSRVDYSAGSIQLGKWTRFVVFFKCSYGSDGILTVWKDGSQVASRTGPNTYNFARQYPDDVWKFGMYKSYWKNNQPPATTYIVYFDEIRAGNANATFDEMNKTGIVSPAQPPAPPVLQPPVIANGGGRPGQPTPVAPTNMQMALLLGGGVILLGALMTD